MVEGPCDSDVIPDGAALSAYQYFENVRNFLDSVEGLGLPTFEASDLEQVCICSFININRKIYRYDGLHLFIPSFSSTNEKDLQCHFNFSCCCLVLDVTNLHRKKDVF